MDEEKVELAIKYSHDIGFDEGYQVCWEDGYAEGVAQNSDEAVAARLAWIEEHKGKRDEA